MTDKPAPLKIKPCPFCGRQPVLTYDKGGKTRVASVSLSCGERTAKPCIFGPAYQVTGAKGTSAIRGAVEHWNTRFEPNA